MACALMLPALMLPAKAGAQQALAGDQPAGTAEGLRDRSEDLFGPLEPMPEPDLPLPPLPTEKRLPPEPEADEIAFPAPPQADPLLLTPMPPLEDFDPAPREDFVFTETAAEAVRYSVSIEGLAETGLEGSFRRISALVRGASRSASRAQLAARTNADKALLERLLHSEGWYSSRVFANLDPTGEGDAAVSLRVRPGSRYSWREITLDLLPEDKPELGRNFALKPGDPVRAIAVEEAEGALLLDLRRQGYPFAEIGARDVVLDADGPTATYLLTGDTGPAGVFGPIRMEGFQPFDARHAGVIARFSPGDPYDQALLDDFREALIATQQFAGVTVAVEDTGERDSEGRAVTALAVSGNKGPQKLLSGQIGYATQEGLRTEAAWRHRSLLRPEGDFTGRAVIGTEEQRASAELDMRNFGQRDRTLSLLADIANLSRPAYRARTITLSGAIGVASTPIWQKRWTWNTGLLLQASNERERALPDPRDAAGFIVRRTFFIAALPSFLGYDRSDDLLDPTRGFRLGLHFTPEFSRQGGGNETYVRAIADGSVYQKAGQKLVLAARTRLGTIVGADTLDIAPTRRLFAGGGGSVRGYDYQGVGPVGVNDRPFGGRGLFEASVEARYRFGDLGIVAFADAGSLQNGSMPGFDGMRYGAGLGARYYSSFGPIRIDIARALDRGPRDPLVALYISIGQAF
ncbi:autotransporter assembly complex protein TamA [Sandaracinobacteroides sp. A072]|uniref:autotransporter assembly complex protein TamA n=1 Tax=Sandaracinobacteroides sp. A072 TaxID=3461146 RepID=UPI004041057B